MRTVPRSVYTEHYACGVVLTPPWDGTGLREETVAGDSYPDS